MQQPNPTRRNAEKRRLKFLIAALALTTALCSLPLFANLGFIPLLLPFILFIVSCALVLPLDGFDRQASTATAHLHAQRRAEGLRHAMPQSVSSLQLATQAQDALFRQTQAAMTAAEAHGIHFASANLTDAEFLRRFAAGETRAGDFRHGDHLRFAWLMLEQLPFDMTEETIAQALRQFLRQITGSSAQFHATHTRGWVRVLAAFPQRTFADVLIANSSQLHSTALTRFWSPALLESEAARSAPIPTDRSPLPAPAARRTRRYREGNTSLPPAPHAPTPHAPAPIARTGS